MFNIPWDKWDYWVQKYIPQFKWPQDLYNYVKPTHWLPYDPTFLYGPGGNLVLGPDGQPIILYPTNDPNAAGQAATKFNNDSTIGRTGCQGLGFMPALVPSPPVDDQFTNTGKLLLIGSSFPANHRHIRTHNAAN